MAGTGGLGVGWGGRRSGPCEATRYGIPLAPCELVRALTPGVPGIPPEPPWVVAVHAVTDALPPAPPGVAAISPVAEAPIGAFALATEHPLGGRSGPVVASMCGFTDTYDNEGSWRTSQEDQYVIGASMIRVTRDFQLFVNFPVERSKARGNVS